MLIIVSGPDRVGKSTLIERMESELGIDSVFSVHHSAPPKSQDNIFDFYKEDISSWIDSGKQYAIFDRAWPCSFILEQHRRRNVGHLEDLIDLELWIKNVVPDQVVHLAQLRPWHWSAPLHVQEVLEECGDVGPWYVRDQYVSRMQEHRVYTEQLLEFYEHITMFPHVTLTESTSGIKAIELCRRAAGNHNL